MDTNIKRQIDSLGPWITGFSVDGFVYGGSYIAERDGRLHLFIQKIKQRHAKPELRILECGCLEGGHTALLGMELPHAKITAVDVREDNLHKARLLTLLRGCKNEITWLKDDLDGAAQSLTMNYDAILCVGLLYHLRRPDLFLKRAAKSSPYLWLWTVYCAEQEVTFHEGGYHGRIYQEPTAHPLSSVREESFFPSLESLLDMLWAAGYKGINLLWKEMTINGNGPAILLEASTVS